VAGPGRSARRRLNAQAVAAVEARPYQSTPSDVFLASSRPLAAAGIFMRMGRGGTPARSGVGAPASALAHGNSVVTSDARGQARAAYPGHGQAGPALQSAGPDDESPYGSISGRQLRRIDTPPAALNITAATPAFQHGRLIARDRHVIENQGRTTSSNREQATGANPNPEKDGPPRPAWKMLNRTLSWQIGADSTANLDNGQFHAATMAGDRKFPLATQGQEWSMVYGGTPFLAQYRAYGERGSKYPGAPAPRVKAEPGGPVRFNTLIAEGDPGDGPQKVYGGLPWGLHSPTVPPVQQTKGMLAGRFKQVKPVWNVRPQNSKRAGQSWSQSMVSLSGQQAVKLSATPPIRQPGMNSRWLGI
jgi:hypothetical protein